MNKAEITQLMRKVDLASVVRESGVELIPTGDRFKAICPLPDHPDTNPSFYIYPDGHFYCFGCYLRGNAINYLRLKNSWSFQQAIQYLTSKQISRIGYYSTLQRHYSKITPDDVIQAHIKNIQRLICTNHELAAKISRELDSNYHKVSCGQLPPSVYFTEKAKLEWQLEGLDSSLSSLHHELISLYKRRAK